MRKSKSYRGMFATMLAVVTAVQSHRHDNKIFTPEPPATKISERGSPTAVHVSFKRDHEPAQAGSSVPRSTYYHHAISTVTTAIPHTTDTEVIKRGEGMSRRHSDAKIARIRRHRRSDDVVLESDTAGVTRRRRFTVSRQDMKTTSNATAVEFNQRSKEGSRRLADTGGNRIIRSRRSKWRPPFNYGTAAMNRRRQRRDLKSGAVGAGALLPRLRGGSAGGWRVVAQEGRRERQTIRNVLLYYPNLIGYLRLALVLTSYYLAETNWKASSCCYLVAFAGDAVDGYVARKFNQASRFGAVLDMVTDRSSTAGLLLVLSRLYGRKHAFAFLVLMFVDLFSHWMHISSVANQHHKATTTLRRRNVLIRTYYDSLCFFGFCCIGTELFYVLLYLLHFVAQDTRVFDVLHKACYFVCLPACVLKQLVNFAQIASAARSLALEELDQQH